MKTIKIEVPALTENVRIVESFIDNSKTKFNLDDDVYGNIMIAVTEAVKNAIQHGSKEDPNKNVSITLELEESIIKFIIEDSGVGFDYNNIPDPTEPENIESPGGRGIFIMNHLSDEVEFKEKGRVVELSFYMN